MAVNSAWISAAMSLSSASSANSIMASMSSARLPSALKWFRRASTPWARWLTFWARSMSSQKPAEAMSS